MRFDIPTLILPGKWSSSMTTAPLLFLGAYDNCTYGSCDVAFSGSSVWLLHAQMRSRPVVEMRRSRFVRLFVLNLLR